MNENQTDTSDTETDAKGASLYLCILGCVFILTASTFVAVLEWVGQATGATMLPRQMAAAQNQNLNLVVLPAQLQHWAAFKLPRVVYEKPDVVIIGSSRGNEVRGAMLRPYKFYNASLTAWNLEQMLAVFDEVTKVNKPRVIILSLDYFMFTNTYAQAVSKDRTMIFDNEITIKYQSEINLIRFIYDYPSVWRSKFPAYLFGPAPTSPGNITWLGLDAIRAEAGFRWDGSFLYGQGTFATAEKRTRGNIGLIEAMPGGPKIDVQQLSVLKRIAALANERKITLLAVQWPIFKASLDYLDNEPSYHFYAGVWRDFESPEMAAELRSLGIGFYDLSRLPIAADSRYFIDAAHAAESGMLDAFIHLNEDQNFHALFPLVDVNALRSEKKAAEAMGEYFAIYGNRF